MKNKKYPILIVGWTYRPPIGNSGQDIHPTKLDNLFLGNLLVVS